MSKVKCSYTKLVDIDELVPNPRNTNNHPEKQIEVLAKIIKARGIRHPIIVSKRSGFIVAGHGRLDAFKLLGIKKVPIDEQEFKNDADEYAFLEADNHIAKYAEFNQAKMLENFEALDIDPKEFDFEEIGMIEFEFEKSSEVKNTNEEIDIENFGNDLEHTCPKCGFEFND